MQKNGGIAEVAPKKYADFIKSCIFNAGEAINPYPSTSN
jgi:hypothetical protein